MNSLIMQTHSISVYVCAALLSIGNVLHGQPADSADAKAAGQVDYAQVASLLSKYCSGCHNDREQEGDFSVSSFATVRKGTQEGPVIIPGKPQQSLILKLLSGESDSQMPPKDEPQPTAEEIELLRQWIAQGAHDSHLAQPSTLGFSPPLLPKAAARFHHVGAACGVSRDTYVVGMLGQVQLRESGRDLPNWIATGLSGKVNSLRLSADRKTIVVGCGIAGVGGEALLLDVADGQVLQRFVGHSDAIYCAATTPDGRLLATGSYDRKILLWDISTGEQVRELTGHNGPIYDLDFDVSGQVLATASGDQTVKLWHVASGQRLDTLGQPEGEQRCVRFSPDGQTLVAGGADKQLRKWQVTSRTEPAINPLLIARYAHESEIVQVEFLDAQHLLSTSTDKSVKLWEAEKIVGQGTVAQLSDVPVGLFLAEPSSLNLSGSRVIQMDGRHVELQLPQVASQPSLPTPATSLSLTEPLAENSPLDSALEPRGTSTSAVVEVVESEPNNVPQQANSLSLPVTFSGVVAAMEGDQSDQDLVRFHALQGQTWICEVNAARQDSPLDSHLEILDAHGQPVLRTRLQATRASYFTFRGKDSATSDDFRLHKWEDMELDEYLYSNGEVNRLWLYPRGPDSGFKVYPGAGSRHTFFDTTPLAHALGTPTYVVRELAADETPLPNGLPVIPIWYENDDDAERRRGKDSRLTFVCPADGEYMVRIRDARGFGGPDFRYQLTIRQPQPNFKLKVSETKVAMPVGSGREWSVEATRFDGLDGPIAVQLHGLPAGVLATNPLIIEAGQQVALGTIFVTESLDSQVLQAKQFEVSLTASAQVAGRTLQRELEEKLSVAVSEASEVQLRLFAANQGDDEVEELTIRPGETISARVVVERNRTDTRIELGKEDSGRNLPHGAFVDNIGLNGLLIPEGQMEREFYITAAPKVLPGRRQFHLKSATAGKPTSKPIWLHVLAPDEVPSQVVSLQDAR
jgi:WD40 repeat protein/mono/diheme cytochrome c family protein